MIEMADGEKIYLERRRAGISQAQLAKISGVSRNAISMVERNVTEPNLRTMVALCLALDLNFDISLTENGPIIEID